MGKPEVVCWVVADKADPFVFLVTNLGGEPGAIPVIPTDRALGYWCLSALRAKTAPVDTSPVKLRVSP